MSKEQGPADICRVLDWLMALPSQSEPTPDSPRMPPMPIACRRRPPVLTDVPFAPVRMSNKTDAAWE